MSSMAFGNNGLSLRIKKLEDVLKMTPSAMAEAGGCSRATYYRYRNGDSLPTLSFLIKILNRENSLNAEWLLKGEGEVFKHTEYEITKEGQNLTENGRDFYHLPLIEMESLNGNREVKNVNEFIESSETIAIPKSLLDLLLKTESFKNTFIMLVQDDSMVPEVKPGGLVLVDQQQNRPTEGIFVVKFDNYVRIKILQPIPGGRLMLSAVNKKYEPIVIEEKYKDFEILGRIMLTTNRL